MKIEDPRTTDFYLTAGRECSIKRKNLFTSISSSELPEIELPIMSRPCQVF